MYKKIFIIAFAMVLGSFAIMIYSSTSHNNNLFPLGMGLMLFGGILLAVSKAMKKATENGRSLIDEIIDMQGKPVPKIKTKNISVKGKGNTVDSYKKNTTNYAPAAGSNSSTEEKKAALVFNELKTLIENNKLSKCLEQMREFFKANGNATALNEVIHLRSRLRENDDRYNSGLIDDAFHKGEKNKISYAILSLIDQEVKE